jgi:ABC-type polysaccharide/polyol phosphate export permease
MQQKTADPRIDKMYGGDWVWSLVALAVLWFTYAFVFWRVMADAGDNDVLLALAVSGAVVLLFNTASIFAMLNHYAHDKEHIYGLDIHYLDEMTKQ